MGMLKLVDRPRLGRGEIIHISSSLITHRDSINVLYNLIPISIFTSKYIHNYKYVVD
jgi:hypothetical protein